VTAVHLLPYGDAAVLAEVGGVAEALALHADLVARPPAGTVDLVPGERTVLVRFDPGATSAAVVRADLASRPVHAGADDRRTSPDVLRIPVVYDGADLAGLARRQGRSVADLVAAHQRVQWRVAFVGFAPGFGYLVPESGDWREVARRDDPRTSVPAGSVAAAGRYTGVYPGSSPGGWQLLGRTDLAVWDVGREPPALLVPGTRVRFEAVP